MRRDDFLDKLGLTEDIFQVQLSNGNVLDVGWYPENDPEGEFMAVVVPPLGNGWYDWDNPVSRIETSSLDLLLKWVLENSECQDL